MPYRRNRREIQLRFTFALKSALESQLGSRISSTRLSDEFNLRADGTTTITRQTALKWMKGEAIPDAGRLMVLANWLDLDLNEIIKATDSEEPISESNAVYSKVKVHIGICSVATALLEYFPY
jgi:transcriptional regulator with XRE-family HTH domain